MSDSPTQSIVTIPPSIVAAVCRVQSTIEAVSKTQYNKQGGYKFASADDIYAAVTRRMGEAGLMIMPIEMEPITIERVEKQVTDERSGAVSTKIAQWGKFKFGFVLATEQATWFDPRSTRSLFIQILGPQTFNAAESYAQKQYLRGLLKLPTGDMDLDSIAQGDTEDDQESLNGRRMRKSSAEGKRDGSVKLFNELRTKITMCQTSEMLTQVRTLYAEEWQVMPPAWAKTLDDDYDTKMNELQARAA